MSYRSVVDPVSLVYMVAAASSPTFHSLTCTLLWSPAINPNGTLSPTLHSLTHSPPPFPCQCHEPEWNSILSPTFTHPVNATNANGNRRRPRCRRRASFRSRPSGASPLSLSLSSSFLLIAPVDAVAGQAVRCRRLRRSC